MFLISTTEIKAQNADFEFLKKINNIDQTVGLSRFVSNSTTATVISVPATMAVVAFGKTG
jgi:hypothetical protein